MRELDGLKIGVVGTGFVASAFIREMSRRPELTLSNVLTRRPPADVTCAPLAAVTRDLDVLIENCDLVFEATGDPSHAAAVAQAAIGASKPMVTLNAEFHVTCGSAFAASGLVTEAAGDQPGCIADLHENALSMGFEPLVLGNMKGFYNPEPTREEMIYWGGKANYSLPMVTSFTDGTKVQIEQCLAANGLGAGIAREGLIAPREDDLEKAALELGAEADRLGQPITEFVTSSKLPHGVFVVAKHDDEQAAALANYKLRPHPYYLLSTNFCLVHLEVFKTIERMVVRKKPLLTNGAQPRLFVAALAKRDIEPGEVIEHGAGGFDARGVTAKIEARPGCVPICLLGGAHVERKIEKGQIIGMDQVALRPSLALDLWRRIEAKALAASAA